MPSLKGTHTPLLLLVHKNNVLKSCPELFYVPCEESSFRLDYFTQVYASYQMQKKRVFLCLTVTCTQGQPKRTLSLKYCQLTVNILLFLNSLTALV